MANYKELEGFGVQTLATDPDTPGWVGSIFYNSTSGTFKVVKPGGLPAGTWASGGSLNTARAYGGSSGTSKDVAMYFGGYIVPTNYAQTEVYNGTSWTEVNDLNNGRTGIGGFGNSITAATAFGGDEFPAASPRYLTDVENWNGTSWTTGTAIPTATQQMNGAGTQTAGLAIGGSSSTSVLNTSYEYDGSTWTTGGTMGTSRSFARLGCGTQTAALVAGGTPPFTVNTELYNGSSWTEENNLNSSGAQGGGGGTQTSAITAGNQNAPIGISEAWDGTSWTEVADLSTGRYAVGGSGSNNTNAIVYGGYDSVGSNFPTATEEWTAPDVVINTLTTS
jgi:hypothetical protein